MSKAFPKKAPGKEGAEKKKQAVSENSDSQGATLADNSLNELFVSELRDIYWAEAHLTKALPKMIEAAGNNKLRKALTDHLAETTNQVARLEQAFELLGEKIVAKKCDAMEGLTMSGEHVIENTVAATATRDLGLIMSGLKVENFEITTYTGMIQVATSLGLAEVADLLQQNLDEELSANEKLTELSQDAISA